MGDQVIVTASSGFQQDRMHVLAFDAATGKPRWDRQFWATGRTITHPTSANAAPTPASDGAAIFAFYSSNDLVALDLTGKLLWYRGLAVEFPAAGNDVGMSSSPAVVGNVVVAQVENQGDSFVVGVDRATGQTAWKIDRPKAASWCSPIVMPGAAPGEPPAVLLQSPSRLTAVDPATGRELWNYVKPCEGIPSAVAAGSLVYVPSEGVTCLRPSPGKAEPDIVWHDNTLKPGGASLVVHDGRLYLVNRSGVLIVADAATGKSLGKLRLDDSFWGTPVLVGDRLICAARKAMCWWCMWAMGGGSLRSPLAFTWARPCKARQSWPITRSSSAATSTSGSSARRNRMPFRSVRPSRRDAIDASL